MIITVNSSLHILGFVNCYGGGGGVGCLLALASGKFHDIYEFRN